MGRLFAKNGGALGRPITRHFAWGIIPLSWLSKKVSAVLFSLVVIRFPFSPVLILSLQWGAINPIPLGVTSVSLQPNPRFRLSDRFLFHHQFVKEVVFFGWSDYSQVSSKVLTNCSSIAPFRGYSIINVIAWMSVKLSPSCWTNCRAKYKSVVLFPFSASHVISSHLISSHLILPHLISSHLISSHLISSHLISSHLNSSHLIPSHLISSRLISSHLIKPRLISSHLLTSHLTSSHLILSHLVLSHLISSNLVSSHLISSHLIPSHVISSHFV